MIYELIVRPEAEKDLTEAYQWYEERLEGLGQGFLVCVDAAISLIKRNPKLFSVVHGDNIRRALIHRFPYGIFYVLEEARIVVLAIFHASRNPNRWME